MRILRILRRCFQMTAGRARGLRKIWDGNSAYCADSAERTWDLAPTSSEKPLAPSRQGDAHSPTLPMDCAVRVPTQNSQNTQKPDRTLLPVVRGSAPEPPTQNSHNTQNSDAADPTPTDPDKSDSGGSPTQNSQNTQNSPDDSPAVRGVRVARLRDLLAGPMNRSVRLEALGLIRDEVGELGPCGLFIGAPLTVLMFLTIYVLLREDTQ